MPFKWGDLFCVKPKKNPVSLTFRDNNYASSSLLSLTSSPNILAWTEKSEVLFSVKNSWRWKMRQGFWKRSQQQRAFRVVNFNSESFCGLCEFREIFFWGEESKIPLKKVKLAFKKVSASFFSLKLECEKLASEKMEIQRHYVMVNTSWQAQISCFWMIIFLSFCVMNEVDCMIFFEPQKITA